MRFVRFWFMLSLLYTLPLNCLAAVTPLLVLHNSLTEVAFSGDAEYRKVEKAIEAITEYFGVTYIGCSNLQGLDPIRSIMALSKANPKLLIPLDENGIAKRSFSLDAFCLLNGLYRTGMYRDIQGCIQNIIHKDHSCYKDPSSGSITSHLDVLQWVLISPLEERKKFVKWVCKVMKLYKSDKEPMLDIIKAELINNTDDYRFLQLRKKLNESQKAKLLQNGFADIARIYGAFKEFDDVAVAEAIVEIIDPETTDSKGQIVRPLREAFAKLQKAFPGNFKEGITQGITKNERKKFLPWAQTEKTEKDEIKKKDKTSLYILESLAYLGELLKESMIK